MYNKYLSLAVITLAMSVCAFPALQKLVSGFDTTVQKTESMITQGGQKISQILHMGAQEACKECGKKPEERNPLITEEICKNWSKEACESRGFKFGEEA